MMVVDLSFCMYVLIIYRDVYGRSHSPFVNTVTATTLDDGNSWRKYGQKRIQQSPNPRYVLVSNKLTERWHHVYHAYVYISYRYSVIVMTESLNPFPSIP
jgi:hypothetical protein